MRLALFDAFDPAATPFAIAAHNPTFLGTAQGLSRYKHPERLVIADTLPRNPFGKVIKKELRESLG